MNFKKFDSTDYHRVWASAISGAVANATGHPIDSIKVRMQTAGNDNTSLFRTMTTMFKKEGIRPFFRGVIPPASAKLVLTACFFTLNGYLKDRICDYKREKYNIPPDEKIILPLSNILLIGGFCGLCLGPLLSPAELIKIQLQVDKVMKPDINISQKINTSFMNTMQHSKQTLRQGPIASMAQTAAYRADMMSDFVFGLFNLGGNASNFNENPKITNIQNIQPNRHIGRYTGLVDCTITVIRRKALLRGMLSTALRLIPGWGVYMYSYEAFNRIFDDKNTIGNNKPLDGFSSSLRIIVGGGIAGTTAWVASYPFDYVKTQIQPHPIEKWNIFRTYKKQTIPLKIQDVVKNTYNKYGLKGFFRGLSPCVIRGLPVNITQFWAYEAIFQFLEGNDDDTLSEEYA